MLRVTTSASINSRLKASRPDLSFGSVGDSRSRWYDNERRAFFASRYSSNACGPFRRSRRSRVPIAPWRNDIVLPSFTSPVRASVAHPDLDGVGGGRIQDLATRHSNLGECGSGDAP